VFTNKVELLKLAVILALWAAVVAAFVSVLYRRQSDVDQAKVRDLKLVYDLQLDREISARREYELSVETQLRRELVSELRAQSADEVAGLRAELAALRANLEILFDADLSDRPAIETDRSGFRGYSDWAPASEPAGRVTSSRIDTDDRDNPMTRTDESPIIDVPEEPNVPEYDWAPPTGPGGAHRLPSDLEREGRRRRPEEPRAWPQPPAAPPRPMPPPPPPQAEPATRETQFPWPPGQEPPKPAEPNAPVREPEQARGPGSPGWRPAPAEGQWIPAGAPGSNWVAPPASPTPEPPPAAPAQSVPPEQAAPAQPAAPDLPAQPAANGSSAEYVGRRRAREAGDEPFQPDTGHSQPAMSSPSPDPRRGRHSAPPEAADPGRPGSAPTLATEPAAPPPHPEQEPAPEVPRHRSADDPETGGQSVADLLARLQAAPTGGGRRRRREE
jgi:hypothetical protein